MSEPANPDCGSARKQFVRQLAALRSQSPVEATVISAWIQRRHGTKVAVSTINDWFSPVPRIPRSDDKFLLVIECLHAKAQLPWTGRDSNKWRKLRAAAFHERRSTPDHAPIQPVPATADSLGVPGFAQFMTVEQYFRPLLRPDSRVHHLTPFVGHEELADNIVDALCDTEIRVVVLSGPAGRGKTRLLLEVLRRFEIQGTGTPVHIHDELLPLNPAALGALASDCIVVMEDVHRRTEALRTVLGYLRRTRTAKLVITARPSRDTPLSHELAQASFHTGEASSHVVAGLDRPHAEQLVQQLSSGLELAPRFTEMLVGQAQTVPFVAVVAIAMIRRGELTTGRYDDDTFRAEILARYGAVETEGVQGMDPASARALLELIAVLAPLNVSDTHAMDLIADFLRVGRRVVLERIDRLSDHGAVLIAGTCVHAARVVPDILADHLLLNAAAVNGNSTGFVDAVWQSFGQHHGSHLIDTFAELDWRQRQSAASPNAVPDLFAPVWSDISQRIVHGDCDERVTVLGHLSRTAATQPGRVVDLLRHVMANPGPETEVASGWRITHQKVLETAVPLLTTCATVDTTTLGDVLDMLWTITRTAGIDEPATAAAQQALSRLATIRNSTWPAAGNIIVERVARWLGQPHDHPHHVTPLSVLTPLLEKSGSTTEFIGNQFHHSVHAIDPRVLEPLRRHVIELATHIAKTSSIRRAIEAIDLLGKGLREPRADFGREVGQDEILGWESDSLLIAARLRDIAESTDESLHRLVVWEILCWHADHAGSSRVRELCVDACAAIEARAHEDSVIICLAAPAMNWRRKPVTVDSIVEQQETRRRVAAAQLWKPGTAEAVIGSLAERVLVISEARRTVRGLDFLVREVLDQRPSASEALLDAVIAEASRTLVSTIPVLLNGLAHHDATRFMARLTHLLADDHDRARAAVTGFLPYDWISIVPDSASLLLAATENTDAGVRSEAVKSLAVLIQKDPSHLVCLRRFLEQHPHEVREAINAVYGYRPAEDVSALGDAECRDLLSIVITMDLDIFPHAQLINTLARHDPAAVVAAITERAIDGKLYITGAPSLSETLTDPKMLTSWLIESANRDQRSKLQLEWVWPTLAGETPTPAARTAIQQIIERRNEHELDFLCAALAQCDQFAITEPDLTNRLIEAMESHPPEAQSDAHDSLIRGALPTETRRIPGQPDTGLQSTAEKAAKLASRADLCHNTRALFTAITQLAKTHMMRDLESDERDELNL